MTESTKGTLVCVGLGMTLGAHITPASLNQIKSADIVFVAASHGVVEKWVESYNPNCVSLQQFYAEDKPRKITYKEMQQAMLEQVRLGKRVCGAFYGHPGVFAQAPHKAIEQAKKEGYQAYMEPGISAEACIYADLGIDPGRCGLSQFETSQYMAYQRTIDPAAYLILWQVGLAGDTKSESFTTNQESLASLVEKLSSTYPSDHLVYIYEAKVLPTDKIRAEQIELVELVRAELSMISTLVIPPVTRLIDIKDKPMSNRAGKFNN